MQTITLTFDRALCPEEDSYLCHNTAALSNKLNEHPITKPFQLRVKLIRPGVYELNYLSKADNMIKPAIHKFINGISKDLEISVKIV
jgi:hypothetical protein